MPNSFKFIPYMLAQVDLPIVKSNPTIFHKICLWGFAVLIPLLIISAFVDYQLFTEIVLIPFCILGALNLFLKIMVPDFAIIGKAVLTIDTVTIDTGGKSETYPLAQLKNITLFCREFEGDMTYSKIPDIKSGANYNSISFEYEDTPHNYLLLLKREYMPMLNFIFQNWRYDNYQFQLFQKSGKPVNELT